MTTTDQIPVETEILQQYLGADAQDVLRTKPRSAGHDLFSDRAIEVFADLGRREEGADVAFRGGGFISVYDVDPEGGQGWGLDISENDAVTLISALAFAIEDLRATRGAQS